MARNSLFIYNGGHLWFMYGYLGRAKIVPANTMQVCLQIVNERSRSSHKQTLLIRNVPLTEEGEFLQAIVTKKLSLYD